MASLEETIQGNRKSFVNIEETMCRIMHTQTSQASSSQTSQGNHKNGENQNDAVDFLTGKGMKLEIPKFNEAYTKDWIYRCHTLKSST